MSGLLCWSSGTTSTSTSYKHTCLRIIGLLVGINILLWILTLSVTREYPMLLSPAILSYTFGLRHAVDADHIAAIDNVTRRLLLDGKYPATVGLFFSLGHSTVVILVSLGVVFTTNFLPESFQGSQEIGQLISTSVSAFFLLLIGAINLRVFYHTFHDWKKVRRGQQVDQSITVSVVDEGYAENEQLPIGAPQGFAAVCCPAVFRVIDSPWKMYPLGFLFGFGFDTASEVALLGIAALTSHQEIPAIAILLLPLLFTAGMCLIDTLDGIFMVWAYGWAFVSPAKKIFYNMFLTGTSACVAFFVGTVEVGGILVDKLHLSGSFWSSWKALSENFETLGFVIIGIFAVSFLSSVIMLKLTSNLDYNSQEQVQMEVSEHDVHLARVETEMLNEKTPLIGGSPSIEKLPAVQVPSAVYLGPCICHEKFHDRAQRSQIFFQQPQEINVVTRS